MRSRRFPGGPGWRSLVRTITRRICWLLGFGLFTVLGGCDTSREVQNLQAEVARLSGELSTWRIIWIANAAVTAFLVYQFYFKPKNGGKNG